MFALDHIVILVRDLAKAIEDYTALGFTIIPGGEHQGGASHNALIAFAEEEARRRGHARLWLYTN
ncbi:MAG: hypothetical protein C4309_13850, partial [Chloroflexota bacterium]